MKKIIALLLCVLMVLGMAACANTTTDAATNSDSTADTAKTDTADTTSADTAEDNTASDDVVTITYSYWGTPDEAASVQAVADKFHEEYPNILVEVMAIPNEEYVTKLNTLATESRLLLADKGRCARILAVQTLKLFLMFTLPWFAEFFGSSAKKPA